MQTEGIAKNIFNIMDAAYYAGRDADNALNPDARGGKYAKVFGPNQILVDTGWSTVNAWNGQHQLQVRYFSDTETTYGLVVEYWAKDAAGNATLVFSRDILYHNDISPKFGEWAGNCWFHENYQYRIIVKSHPTIGHDNYVGVDFIRIIPIHSYSLETPTIYAGSEDVPAVGYIYDFYMVVHGDGSSGTYAEDFTIPTESLAVRNVQANVLGGVGEYYETIDSWDLTKITIRVTKRTSGAWSGGIAVVGSYVSYESIVSLKP